MKNSQTNGTHHGLKCIQVILNLFCFFFFFIWNALISEGNTLPEMPLSHFSPEITEVVFTKDLQGGWTLAWEAVNRVNMGAEELRNFNLNGKMSWHQSINDITTIMLTEMSTSQCSPNCLHFLSILTSGFLHNQLG